MKAEIVSIGTELLLGDIVDTNAAHIAQKLREIGLDLHYKTTVGDNDRRIAEVIGQALDRVDIVITTGGLGPTVDDVTREGIARATGRPLEFQQELLDQISERFRCFRVKMSQNNQRQAYIPQGAAGIENPVGTAPIFILETEKGVVMVLPGVPREMKHLLEHELIPWIKAHMDAPAVIRSRVLRTAGVGESQIDDRIGDLMTGYNPTVGLAAHSGQTDIRITAKAGDEQEADRLIAPVEAELRQRLGDWIYGTGTETLEEVVCALLADQQASLASVEGGTQGQLKERLNRATPEQAGIVITSQVYEKAAGLASLGIDETAAPTAAAEAAAQRIREASGATYGLAAIIRPEEEKGETGTAIATASQDGVHSRYYAWTDRQRTNAHVWAATQALAMLRRQLLKSRRTG